MSVNEFTHGQQHDVPLIVGADAGERSLQTSVPLLGSLHSPTRSPRIYVTHMPTGWRTEPRVAFHDVEIPNVFGYTPNGLLSPTALFLSRGGSCTSEDPGTDDLDDGAAERTMNLRSELARTGNPSVLGLVEWPAYTEESDTFLDIGSSLVVETSIAESYVTPTGHHG